jgi:Family of unknown function (DUF5706)
MGKKDKKDQAGKPEAKEAEPAKGPSSKAIRSADTFLRIGVGAQLDFSKSADTKAQVMLTICAAISTYSLGRTYPTNERYPAMILVVFSLIAALFAVASMKPPTPRRKPPRPGEPGFNILTFTHFAGLTPAEYRAAMRSLINQPELMHDQVTDAMFAYGAVFLKRQYFYLEWCYRIFLLGLILSALGWALVLY